MLKNSLQNKENTKIKVPATASIVAPYFCVDCGPLNSFSPLSFRKNKTHNNISEPEFPDDPKKITSCVS